MSQLQTLLKIDANAMGDKTHITEFQDRCLSEAKGRHGIIKQLAEMETILDTASFERARDALVGIRHICAVFDKVEEHFNLSVARKDVEIVKKALDTFLDEATKNYKALAKHFAGL